MVRWVRVVALGVITVAMVAFGVGVGLFLVANGGWVAVGVPPWLHGILGEEGVEVWLPALLAGWVAAPVCLVALLAWSVYYVWRRRQYEALVAKLERELAHLRNLPLTSPAPLEDLPESPDPEAARSLARGESRDEERDERESG